MKERFQDLKIDTLTRKHLQRGGTSRRRDSDSKHSFLQVTITYRVGMETKGKIIVKSYTGHNTCGAIRCAPQLVSEQEGPVWRIKNYRTPCQEVTWYLSTFSFSIFTSLSCISSCIFIFIIAALEKKINMYCIASRKF